MRAVRCREKSVEVVDVPAPTGSGVRVRIRSAGICGSDLHMIDAGFPLPHTLGHEIAGVTEDGTPVAIEPLIPCGRCGYCRTGAYNLCERGASAVIGVARDGGMAEEIRVPERCLVPLSRAARPADACLVEPLSVAVHGLRRAGLRGDQRVAIVGGGSVGLCALAAAGASGAEVGLVARHDAQIEAGARLGATPSVDGGYDLVIDAAGTASALQRAVELCRPDGTLLLLATYWSGLTLPGFALCLKEIRVVPASMHGRHGVARDVDVAAALLAARPEVADALITHRFPLDAAREAFATAADRKSGAIKVVLEP
jgi:L-iditol 2-dehydrogenase